MASYSQDQRALKVFTPLGTDKVLLADLTGHEGLSQLFQFRLHLLAPRPDTIPFDKLLNHPVTVEIVGPEGGTRFINGIVSALTQGRRDTHFTHYHADLVPRFWLWTRRFRSRIFQDLSVPDIVEQALAPLQDQVRFDIEQPRSPLSYVVQWQETDFQFLSRAMEAVGLSYYFEHSRDGHTLVVTDRSHPHPRLAEGADVPFDDSVEGLRDVPRVLSWEKRQEIQSTHHSARDYDFQMFPETFDVQRSIQHEVEVGTVTHQLIPEGTDDLEHYEYPGKVSERMDVVEASGAEDSKVLPEVFRAERLINYIRAQRGAVECLNIEGTSTCPQFLPGHEFTLHKHFDADGPYYLVRVEHRAKAAIPEVGRAGPALEYENRFSCLPAALPYRPARSTPRPRIHGLQTAEVVGPPGQEIHVDKYGRVKVQFFWDRDGKKDGNSSCWIRVAQVWAGHRWGAFFWPRVGNEVLVAFKNGEPDRPVIVGCLYNSKNMPPVDLPKDAMIGGFKSLIFGGDPIKNFNAVLFRDAPIEGYVQVHSETVQVSKAEVNSVQITPKAAFFLNGSFE